MEKNEDNSYLQLSPKTSLAGEFITKSDLAFLNVFSRCSTYKVHIREQMKYPFTWIHRLKTITSVTIHRATTMLPSKSTDLA